MQRLPLSKDDYNRSLPIADFISKIKIVLEATPEVKDILFTPEIKGYSVSFSYNENSYTLRLKAVHRPFSKYRLKLAIFREGRRKKTFSFSDAEGGAERVKKFVSK